MEWTLDTGEHVTWDWAQPKDDGSGQADGVPYAIGIRINGRRLRGGEADQWKQRIGAQFSIAEP